MVDLRTGVAPDDRVACGARWLLAGAGLGESRTGDERKHGHCAKKKKTAHRNQTFLRVW
jgi:hypothetical protein